MMAVSAGGTGFLFKAGKQVEERGKNGSSCFRSFLCITVPAFNSTAQTNAGAGLKRFLCSLNTGGSCRYFFLCALNPWGVDAIFFVLHGFNRQL